MLKHQNTSTTGWWIFTVFINLKLCHCMLLYNLDLPTWTLLCSLSSMYSSILNLPICLASYLFSLSSTINILTELWVLSSCHIQDDILATLLISLAGANADPSFSLGLWSHHHPSEVHGKVNVAQAPPWVYRTWLRKQSLSVSFPLQWFSMLKSILN